MRRVDRHVGQGTVHLVEPLDGDTSPEVGHCVPSVTTRLQDYRDLAHHGVAVSAVRTYL